MPHQGLQLSHTLIFLYHPSVFSHSIGFYSAVSPSLKIICNIAFHLPSMSSLSCHWTAKKNWYMAIFCTSLTNHFLTIHNLFSTSLYYWNHSLKNDKIASNCQVQWPLLCFCFFPIILSPWKFFRIVTISYQICILYLIVCCVLLDLHLTGVVQIKHSLSCTGGS